MRTTLAFLLLSTATCASPTARRTAPPGEPPEAPLDFRRALAEPREGCSPKPPKPSGNRYVDCVARINQLRSKCQGLPPLARWKAGERCADEHAKYDSKGNRIHEAMQKDICAKPFVYAQNECVGYVGYTENGAINHCLQKMWDEGPGEDFHAHGHYVNMSSREYSKVACGFYETPKGELWSVQNFSR